MRGSIQRCANEGSTETRSCRELPAAGGGRAHAVVQQRQRFLHAAQQCRAGGVQHDAPAAALEQVETQLFFQATDLLADGAMGQVQAFGRGAQVLQFGHRAKGGQGVQG